MRDKLVVFLFLCLTSGACYWAYLQIRGADSKPEVNLEPGDNVGVMGPDCRIPVPTNRGPDVPDGFQGDRHPLLLHGNPLEVKAYWNPPQTDALDLKTPPEVLRLYRNVSPDVASRLYSERELSSLLPPDAVRAVGQVWALDPQRVAVFLQQFHPAVSTHSASAGRRPGPDGAFAVLRGVSASHLDIAFRVHAEFELLPKSSKLPLVNVWYTPACFLGRLVVNRTRGTVEYLQLGVPEHTTNVHSTYWTIYGLRGHNTHHVDRMELVGGSLHGFDGMAWTDQLETAKAHDLLATAFYKFKEIRFLPFEQALAASRAQDRPILAVVLLGALDDQSC